MYIYMTIWRQWPGGPEEDSVGGWAEGTRPWKPLSWPGECVKWASQQPGRFTFLPHPPAVSLASHASVRDTSYHLASAENSRGTSRFRNSFLWVEITTTGHIQKVVFANHNAMLINSCHGMNMNLPASPTPQWDSLSAPYLVNYRWLRGHVSLKAAFQS